MDSDRIEGKTKQLEGEAQEGWGKLKDTARDAVDDAKDALDRDERRGGGSEGRAARPADSRRPENDNEPKGARPCRHAE